MNLDESGRKRLAAVVDTARDELGGTDVDDVPHRLRKVAASSARTLPPPLEKVLIDELVADDAFRSRVLERWDRDDRDDAIGRAFLDDPADAFSTIEAEAARARSATLARRVDDVERENSKLRAELAEAKRRAATLRSDAKRRVDEVKAADKAARARLERAASIAVESSKDAEAAATASEERTRQVEGELAEMRAALARMGTRERKRTASPAPGRAPSSASPPPGPRDLATWLDATERAMRPYRPADGDAGEPASPSSWALPVGVAPDRAEVIDAISAIGAAQILIDGYNVSGAIDPSDFPTRSGRDRVLVLARKLARSSATAVSVVFDASGVDGRDRLDTELGVSVVFADGSADDRIVDLVMDAPRSVVVTNDRELRERCIAAGAIAVWSDALIAWAATRQI